MELLIKDFWWLPVALGLSYIAGATDIHLAAPFLILVLFHSKLAKVPDDG